MNLSKLVSSYSFPSKLYCAFDSCSVLDLLPSVQVTRCKLQVLHFDNLICRFLGGLLFFEKIN